MIPISKLYNVPESDRPVFLRDLFSLYYLRGGLRLSVFFPLIFLCLYFADLLLVDFVSDWFILSIVFFGFPVVYASVYFFVYYDFYNRYRRFLE